MADTEILPTKNTFPNPNDLDLPVAVIICITVACYVFIVIIALIIKQCLQSAGLCGECRFCGSEDQPCCECCISLGQACNCCQKPKATACLDRCCPQRKQVDCVDILLCQCCTAPAPGKEPLCGSAYCDCICICSIPECDTINCLCFECENMSCNCGCTAPECENVNCLCFQLNMKGQPLQEEQQQPHY